MAEKNEKLLKKDLQPAEQARMERILDSDPKMLSTPDRDYIFARRDYLTADEQKAMGITAASIAKVKKANEEADGEDVDESEDDDV